VVALYVTSSVAGSGKTTVIGGLARRLAGQGKSVGYFKPIVSASPPAGADADALLLRTALGLTEPVETLAPVFGTEFELSRNARMACVRAAPSQDVVLIEGGRSPISTAAALDARIIGVEVFSADMDGAAAFYKEAGGRLAGIIVNRVPRHRIADVTAGLSGQLAGAGLKMLGALPEDRALTSLTVAELVNELGGKVVAGPAQSAALIENVMLGAMTPDPGPLYFGQRSNKAVVVKSERPDLQIAALQTSTVCLVLAGKSAPIPAVLARAADTRVPLVTVADDVPTVIGRLEAALRNARLSAAKVERAAELIAKHADLPQIDQTLGLK